jgi:hypothetical protein
MKYRKLSWVAYSDLGDGSGVLLDLKNVFYYSLNNTANLLWREFENEGFFTERRLALKLLESCETADHTTDQILLEVRTFVRVLAEYELISTFPQKGNGRHAKRSSHHQHGTAKSRSGAMEKTRPQAGTRIQEGTLPAAHSEEGIPAG